MKIGLRKWLGKQGSNKERHFVLYRHEKTIYKRIAKRKWKHIMNEIKENSVINGGEVFRCGGSLSISRRNEVFVLLEINQTKNDCHIVGVYKSHQGVSDAISHIKTMCADNISHKILIFDLEK